MHPIIELTKKLIRFKTLHSRPEEIRRCADFIADYLTRCGAVYRHFSHNGYPSILVTRPDGYVPVLLMSHIDVVDAPDELFEPLEKNGQLYGRGSKDDKYAVALSLVLLEDALTSLRTGRRGQEELPLGILITSDEEIGGKQGACKALEELRTDFCIALDGGSLNHIVVKEKGIVHLKLTAAGKSAHAARPWLGENAIDALIADYHILKKHFEVTTPDHWHRTLNFSRITAGGAVNQVPDTAEAIFDVRYTEADDMDAVVEALQAEIGGRIRIVKREPLFEGGNSPHMDLLKQVAPQATIGFEHGASDARHLAAHGIPGIVWGADGDESQHSADEHVSVESVSKLYDALKRFLSVSANQP